MTAPRPTLTDLARDGIAAALWPLAHAARRIADAIDDHLCARNDLGDE